MKPLMTLRFTILCCTLVLLPASPRYAQETGGVGRIKLNSVNTASAATPQKTVVQRRKPAASATKGKVFTTTTGALSVVSESAAMVFIKPINASEFIDKEAIEPGRGQVIFDNLPPGQYHVVAELDGYQDGEGEVTIGAGKIAGLTLRLAPELYTVTIKTNVRAGDVRYRLNAKGQIPQVVAMRGNGQALLTGMRAGEYEIDVRAADAAYKPLPALIQVGKGNTEFEVNLVRALCEEAFSEPWSSLNGWEAPAGWAVASRKLTVRNAGVALPKDECPRHFADFELTSDVKMLNDVGVSFVLRAQDKQSYYLVQLTGAKADEPWVLRGYLVQGGRKQQLNRSVPIDAFAQSMTGKFFSVVLLVKGNVISIAVNDSDTGAELPLGKLTDSGKHFTLGAVGLSCAGTEQFEVARFIVKPQ
ncbi:MAG: carboxypeptidase regulatory-like domain-containing protein [Acidobacteria bacterium]|nr:carboxypeptidase regulatory-like domain-containing protein [Acidobacteriota bacterium]MBI3424418.1 carboxypeptidase regulatory-like domain-containing protein [Acidobacteriota bacterium]